MADKVWSRVHDYAIECLREKRPVYTVSKRVENYITDVKDGSIGRRSAEGITNSSRVTRGMVDNLWSELNGEDGGSYLYFTKALVLAAMPDEVEDLDGTLYLRSDPQVKKIKKARFESDKRGFGGGEGELHKALKEYIYNNPDIALKGLQAGPYQRVSMEYVFPTGDRVDVVLIDARGNILLVEVKPVLVADDMAPFAQAAKYRTLWNILRGRPLNEIRCLVAAPHLGKSPWKHMHTKHGVEALAIDLNQQQ